VGTHYRVRVVSAEFERKSRVERHRLIYDLLTAEFTDGLHALALVAKAPGEP
jgi:BolA protein